MFRTKSVVMMPCADSKGLLDTSDTASRPLVPGVWAPAGALPLALAAALALGAGEAAAQGCPNVGPVAVTVDGAPATVPSLYADLLAAGVAQGPTGEIYCSYGSEDRNNRHVVVHSPAITVVDDFVSGIEALHQGAGHLGVYVHAIDDWQPRTTGTFSHPHPLDLGQGIRTKGDAAEYITGEDSYGIYARHTGEGRVGIDVRNVSVRTAGDYAHGVYASQRGSYRLRNNGDSTRARGAVVVNLVETDRTRDERIRPLIGTRGDYADAVRAEYTRAAAYGHVAVTVEGYTIATGGIVPLGVVGYPRQPGDFDPDRPNVAVDFSRPYVANANYDPDDPNSPQYYNIRLRDDLQQALYAGRVEDVFQELGLSPIFPSGVLQGDGNDRLRGPGAVDIRPHILVYLPVRNPDHDPNDPDSREYVAATTAPVIWNGRYFRALDEGLATDVATCRAKTTAAERNTCFEETIYNRDRDGGNPTGFEARGIYASHEGHGDVRVSATGNVIRTWGADAHGIYATHTGRTVTTPGEGGTTVTTPGGGGVSITVSGGSIGTEGLDSHGVWGRHRGDSGADPDDGWVDPDDIGTGNVNISITDAAIATAGDHARGVYGLIQQTRVRSGTDDDGNPTFTLVEGTGVGDIDIAVTGGAIATGGEGGAYAVHARHENKGDVTVRMTGVAAATESHVVHGVFAEHRGSEGAVAVTVDGGSVATEGDRAHAVYALQSTDGGLTVRIANGATVATEGVGAYAVNAVNNGDGDLTVELNGAINTKGAPGIVDSRQSTEMASVFVLQNGDGDLAFRMTGGAVTAEGDDAHGVQVVRSTAGGGSIDVAGGDVRAEGAGSAGVLAGFAGGGTGTVSVIVGEDASVTGGLVGIQLSAAADADGNFPTRTVRVDGTVRGGSSAGIYLTTGGAVTIGATGRVSAASGIGVFSNGDYDADVTVAGTVEGDVRKEGSGTLGVTLSGEGEIDGDVSADAGRLILDLAAGSTVAGTIHNPVGLTEVRSSIGRILYDNGGTITVTETGRLTGAEIDGRREALRSTAGRLTFTLARGGEATGDIRAQGDLTATVSGTVEGDILGLGSGDHTVTVREGGAVSGTIRLAASTVTVDGVAGHVYLENGGTVAVGGTGRLTGVEGVALRSDTGDLTATLAGEITGNVLALGTGAHRVTVAEGGDVAGTVRVATQVGGDADSTLTVAGAVGRVQLDRGGMLEVGPQGRIRGIGGIAVDAPVESPVHINIQETPRETAGEDDATERVNGRIGGDPRTRSFSITPADGSRPLMLGRLGTADAAPRGPYDLGVDENGNPERKVAPRGRLYEALPSVMLGLNGLSEYQDRMAAPRDASGGWARIYGSRGKWKADNTWTGVDTSTTVESRWKGVQAGLDAPVGENGLFGISLHHRRGSAKVSNGSVEDLPGAADMDLSGTGGGISGTWSGNDVYVDVQAEATWYETDLSSPVRGRLAQDVKGRGYALGVEAGRRIASGTGPLVFIPRAGLAHSKVSLAKFTDDVGSRVSLEDGRSLKGRLGVGLETKLNWSPESRLIGSLDVEHEFKDETKVRVSGTELTSAPDATWLRAGVIVSHVWGDGRYVIQYEASYAKGGGDSYEYGGGLNLKLRF